MIRVLAGPICPPISIKTKISSVGVPIISSRIIRPMLAFLGVHAYI
jgi:hypothetical protein